MSRKDDLIERQADILDYLLNEMRAIALIPESKAVLDPMMSVKKAEIAWSHARKAVYSRAPHQPGGVK